jgi:hypothetical protein
MVQVETIYLLNQKKQAMNSILFSFTFSAGFYVALVLSIDKAKEYRELDFGKNSWHVSKVLGFSKANEV